MGAELALIIKTAFAVVTPMGGLVWYIISTWDKKTERLQTRVDEIEKIGNNNKVDIQGLKTGKVSYDDLNKAISDLEKNVSDQIRLLAAELKAERSEERAEYREDMKEMKELILMQRRNSDK